MTYALDMQKPYLLCTSPVSSLVTVCILAMSASSEAAVADGGSAPMPPPPGWHRPPDGSSARARRRNSGLGGMELISVFAEKELDTA